MNKPIDDLFVFIYENNDGSEDIPTGRYDEGFFPLIAIDNEQIALFFNEAQQLANRSGKTITLYRFSARSAVTTIAPQTEEEPTIQ